MSLAKKGKPSSRGTGWHHTKETVEKIRTFHIGRKRSIETCRKIGMAFQGKLWTEARRRASLKNL
jgi:hypothetical protein